MATDLKNGIDFKSIEDEARKELLDKRTAELKTKVRASLKTVLDAEQVLANAKRAHDDLIAQIKEGSI